MSERPMNRIARSYHLLRKAWGPTPRARDAIVTMIVLAVMITGLAVARVAQRHEVVRAGYELSKETRRLEELRERNRELAVELATLTHPDRLRDLATRLGMIPAQPDQIRVVKISRQVAVAP
jgi:cell division protein FtsL